MKGANALLAVLILLMAVSPCGDIAVIDSCSDEVHFHFSNPSSDNEHLEDVCTPFCSCACCSIPFSNNTIDENELTDLSKSDVQSIQELQFPPPPFKIWQPPKI